jgi:hypothetical protein
LVDHPEFKLQSLVVIGQDLTLVVDYMREYKSDQLFVERLLHFEKQVDHLGQRYVLCINL